MGDRDDRGHFRHVAGVVNHLVNDGVGAPIAASRTLGANGELEISGTEVCTTVSTAVLPSPKPLAGSLLVIYLSRTVPNAFAALGLTKWRKNRLATENELQPAGGDGFPPKAPRPRRRGRWPPANALLFTE